MWHNLINNKFILMDMEFFKKGELKLLWPFYLDSLISSMLFFIPAFMVIYFRNLEFNLFQISVLMAIMPLAMLLFEIPTGAIADIYGRKFSVLLGTIIQGVSFLAIFFLNNYYALLFAFAMAGFGFTFDSGAREAWVTDLVKKSKKNFLHSYFAKKSSIDSFGLVVSGILGAFLVKQFGISIIWIFGGISFFITLFILFFAKEYFVRRKVKVKDSFENISKQSLISINYARNHPVLFLFLIAISIIVFASAFNGSLAWIPFLQELNFPDYAFGYMWSAMNLIGVFAPLISLKILKKNKERSFIINSIILGVFFTLLILFANSIAFAFLIILASTLFFGMSSPVERVYFHKFVKSKLRATVGSVENMLIGFVAVIALPLAGLSIDFIGAKYTIFLSGLLMIPSVIILLNIKENTNDKLTKKSV